MVERRTFGDAASGDEALEHIQGNDREEPDYDDGVTRPLLIERMLASGQYFIVPSVLGTSNGTAVTHVVEPPAGGANASYNHPSGAETPDVGRGLPSKLSSADTTALDTESVAGSHTQPPGA